MVTVRQREQVADPCQSETCDVIESVIQAAALVQHQFANPCVAIPPSTLATHLVEQCTLENANMQAYFLMVPKQMGMSRR